MRLRTYAAPTVTEAMNLVRQELGENAIIVSTTKASGGEGARVTAAIEDEPAFEIKDHEPEPDIPQRDLPATLRQVLYSHGTPDRLIDRLIEAALTVRAESASEALAGAFDQMFSFSPLPEGALKRPIMLIGPPGSGKTVTAAKLAARATLSGASVGAITTDTMRAGAVEQLQAFTRLLKIDLRAPKNAGDLATDVAILAGKDCLIIDSAGCNPFSDAEVEQLSHLINVAEAEPVAVIAAGGDAMEAADIGASLASLGARRLIVTRLDMTRRLGSILAAADAGHFSFADVSITPHVGDGLSAINPASLARLIMPSDDDLLIQTPIREARL